MSGLSKTFNNIVTGIQNIDRDGVFLSVAAITASPLQPAALAAGTFLLASLLAVSHEAGKSITAPTPSV